MSAVIVDTSAWISYFKGDISASSAELIDEALKESRVHVPPIVITELLSARLTPAAFEKMRSFLSDLHFLNVGFDHWVRTGKFRSDLSKSKLHVSSPDAHIAQCALDLGATLVTEDKVFRLIQKHTNLKLGF